ncbi:MAG: hypothetical protein H6552_05465 [Chitinophagales bacterium]|nr:hypothetical protein [Chitinophagales bacterium]
MQVLLTLIIELGGPLVRPTTVSALTNTNKMSFTGTGVNMFNVDGTTFSVDGDNDRVGIGTTAPTQKLEVNGNTLIKSNAGLLNLEGTDHTYIQWYPKGYAAGRKAWTGFGSGSSDDFSVSNENTNADLVLNTTGSGNTISNHNFIATQGLVTGKLDFKRGPSTSSDNTWHSIELEAGYGATTVSVYATGSMDGDMKIQGVDISNLLSATTTWYRPTSYDIGATQVTTSKGTGTTATNVAPRYNFTDNKHYHAICPDGTIGTGWQAYATSRLDDGLAIKCTTLSSGYTTVETGYGIESVLNHPDSDENDLTNFGVCPAGTFIKSISVYNDSYLDRHLRVYCTGIKRQ